MGSHGIELLEKNFKSKTTLMTGFDCYRTYLAFKNHFTRDKFDYFKYGGKTNVSITTFNKRKDRYFFEKMSRQKKDGEIVDYFTAIFSQCDDPQKMWIGEIIESGDKNYSEWQKKVQSLGYIFKQEMQSLCEGKEFNTLFDCKSGTHPIVIKEYLKKNVSIESLIILDSIINFKKNLDKILDDFVWETVSLKISKYRPFLLNSVRIQNYKKILQGIVLK